MGKISKTTTASKTTVNEKQSVWYFIDAFLMWLFGIVMLAAAIPHWENPYYFLGSVYAYKLVDPMLGQFTAVFLPSIQLVVAICLILRIHVDAAYIVTMILFGLFFFVQLFAFGGGLDISCGCFGPEHSSQIGIKSLMFVGTLFIFAVLRIISLMLYRSRYKEEQ
ncbi:MAG: hypothetical protein LBQ66_10725 [Planctomycetaceae bacterium]|jgi:hypothetical protein|nr:hypothetical protein [Planctomycetaceae bacterium]